jgi:dolichol-phosphate mannosyltransferase
MKSNKSISIVIPSYNEVKNISILIRQIRHYLPGSNIIIVDDSSIEENKKLKASIKNKNIVLISRLKKLGRGSAVLMGFKKAITNKNIDYVFEMDSDLAHDPKEFRRFINEVSVYPYDLVIGSRYKSGGKIVNISPNRTIMSRVINNFLYFWLNIKISDYTSGFRLYSSRSIKFILKKKLKASGFIALSEIAYLLYKNGYSISEVPITWNFRRYGKSNVNLRELISSFVFVVRLRLRS